MNPTRERRPGHGAPPTGNASRQAAESISESTAPTAQTVLDLETARELARAGVPIFLCRPALDDQGQWRPDGGHNGCGYWMPEKWQRTSADPAVLDNWRPGMAVCAVMGHGLDAADCDPRHGGDVTRSGLVTAGMWPRAYAEAATPSGGTHELVAALDVASRDGLRDGLDVKAGRRDTAAGRGFIFIAPTVKRSKVDGEIRPYVWTRRPELELWAEERDTDDTGRALAEMVHASRVSKAAAGTEAEAYDGPPFTELPLPAQDAITRWLAGAVEGVQTELRDSASWGETHVDRYKRGWERLQADAAYRLGRLARASWSPLTLEEVEAAFTEAAPTCPTWTREDVTAKWKAQSERGTPAAYPSKLRVDDLSWIGGPVDHETGEVLEASQDGSGATQDDIEEHPDTGTRRLVLVAADSIKPRPVFWLWDGRLALGTLGLLAGREGLGKSTLGYWTAARVTRGELEGTYRGVPKSVLVCATEDSWEHTIVPRLIAAGADLARVFRVEVLNALDIHVGLSLPRDLIALERAAGETDAALLLLDPLMSRLGDLDTHRDAEVRQALEPLVAIADRTGMAVLGVIHHNKSGSTDPLQLVMGSKAFTAVARSVHTVVPDPDDESDTRRLFGTPKNNLGRTDLPTLSFTVVSHAVDTDEGTAWTGRLEWGEEMAGSIGEAMRRAADSPDDKSAASEAGDWLADHLAIQGGTDDSASIKQAGAKAGHSLSALKRARHRIGATLTAEGFPRRTFWTLDAGEPQLDRSPPQLDQQLDQIPRGEKLTKPTEPTERSGSSRFSWTSPDGPEPTEPTAASTGALTLALAAPPGQDEAALAEMLEELGGGCSTCSRFICDCEVTA